MCVLLLVFSSCCSFLKCWWQEKENTPTKHFVKNAKHLKIWRKEKDDDPFRELQDEIDDLRSVQPNLIEEEFDATTFVDVDAEVITVQSPPSDAEIVAELLETDGISDDNDYSGEISDEPVKYPDKNELLQVIKTLQRFLFLDKGDIIQSYASRIESQVDQNFAKKKKKNQASIKDFLNKK